MRRDARNCAVANVGRGSRWRNLAKGRFFGWRLDCNRTGLVVMGPLVRWEGVRQGSCHAGAKFLHLPTPLLPLQLLLQHPALLPVHLRGPGAAAGSLYPRMRLRISALPQL